jgi:hypothetical protein
MPGQLRCLLVHVSPPMPLHAHAHTAARCPLAPLRLSCPLTESDLRGACSGHEKYPVPCPRAPRARVDRGRGRRRYGGRVGARPPISRPQPSAAFCARARASVVCWLAEGACPSPRSPAAASASEEARQGGEPSSSEQGDSQPQPPAGSPNTLPPWRSPSLDFPPWVSGGGDEQLELDEAGRAASPSSQLRRNAA